MDLSIGYSPPSEAALVAALRLIRSRRVGPSSYHRLLSEHGDAAAALDALPGIAAAAGIADYQPCPERTARDELAAGRRAGAVPLLIEDPAYPAELAAIPDAPPLLWVRGHVPSLLRPRIAVIGARNASVLGLRMARGLSAALAEAGVVVVAGLARGIDSAAHEAALAGGTIAAMAGGIDVIYPRDNSALAEAIVDGGGALVTEQPPGLPPVARHFPARNRIISGLCSGVVVVEAAPQSGSLLTARLAAEQGRDVLAVPGHPMDGRAGGCNALIRDGATLVRNAADVLAALHPDLPPPARHPLDTADQARLRHLAITRAGATRRSSTGDAAILSTRVLAALGPSPTDEALLMRGLDLAAAELAAVLLDLELDGRITRLPGGRVAMT